MHVVCLDLEGVLIPEIWINIALKTGIEELKITTRDEPNYDKLMTRRLKILQENEITLPMIQNIIKTMDPLEGASEFIKWLRNYTQVVIVTDSFKEFAMPLLIKLGNPFAFCHNLIVTDEGIIIDYALRIKDMKKVTLQKFKEMNYKSIAIGDSYNDIDMLITADHGILFRPPVNVEEEYPNFPSLRKYEDLKQAVSNIIGF
ncbi:MAG: bifunctional phosphoserine phosphatase/homoserine phosphotransferase ThrH [Candidatus Lokiarchaeota archaeon]|nr:bifunctional phosphoserine phosphatase/homoserine phosphotransferase ThrH [Candidatus Lokiarchaeota archaeon]